MTAPQPEPQSVVAGVVTHATRREAIQSHGWTVVFLVQVDRHEQLRVELLDAASTQTALCHVVARASRAPDGTGTLVSAR